MSINPRQRKRVPFVLSTLVFFVFLFSACQGGDTSGIIETDPFAEIFAAVNPEGFSDLPEDPNPGDGFDALVLCALNTFVLTANTTDGNPIVKYRLTLTTEPVAGSLPASGLPPEELDSGFMLSNADYFAPVVNEIEVDAVLGQAVVYLRAALPSDLGTYNITVLATADGTFTDYDEPLLLVNLTTQKNPCLKSFVDDEAPVGEGTAAGAPPGGAAVLGETATIGGYNLSTNPDTFFLLDDDDNRYTLTDMTELDVTDGFVTVQGRIAPGCGVDTDICVENGDIADPYSDYAQIDTAQRRPDVYTYLPVITKVDNLAITPGDVNDANPFGSCLGGDQITIYGSGFLAGLGVTIDGNVATVTSVLCEGTSGTGEIVIDTPAFSGADPQDVPVVVNNPDGNSSPADTFTYDPDCATINPTIAAAGDTVTISGCGFADDVDVSIGATTLTQVFALVDLDQPGEYFRNSVSQITLLVPDGPNDAGQSVPVTITNPSSASPNNSSTSCTFSYLPVCTSGLSAGSGAGGETITIGGTGFDSDVDLSIGSTDLVQVFDMIDLDQRGEYYVNSANLITFLVPCGANDSGIGHSVVVSDPTDPGTYTSTCGTFDYEPLCDGLTLSRDSAGQTVQVAGCGFAPGVSATIENATFDDVRPDVPTSLSVLRVDSTQISFTVEGGPDDYGEGRTVTITSSGFSSTDCSFSYDPECTDILAAVGGRQEGDIVTITGTGFDANTSNAVTLAFGAAAMSQVTVAPAAPGEYQVQDGNTISVMLPQTNVADFGPVSVSITNDAGGPATSCADFEYEPVCDGVDDGGGTHRAGDTVTITGSGFAPEDTISFGHATMTKADPPTDPGDYEIDDANNITVIVPCDFNDPGTNDVDVSVTDGGTATECTGTTFQYDPHCDGINPTGGSGDGGEQATISGCAFDEDVTVTMDTALTAVTCTPSDPTSFPTNPGEYCRISDFEIRLLTPEGGGNQPIVIDNNGRGDDSDECSYEYVVACSSITPDTGTVGTEVVVKGSGFGPGVRAFFGADDIELTKVTGTPNPGEFRRDSNKQLTLNLPCGGPNDFGLQPITITGALGITRCAQDITYTEHCTGLSATTGECGETIQATGCGFDSGVTYTVDFGTTAATVAYVDANNLDLTVPNGPDGTADADGTVSVAVTGICEPLDDFTYTPTCTSVPATGTCDQTVTIGGCGFSSGGTVSFGSSPATVTSYAFNSLDVTVPNGAADAGTVTVTVDNNGVAVGGDCSLADAFTFLPAISDVDPNVGPESGGMSIDVNGCGFQNNATVEFGSGNLAGVNTVDGNQINVTLPSGTGVVDVIVTNPDDANTDTLAGGFTYDSRPFVTSIIPGEGPEAGGTEVDIAGFQFPTVLGDTSVTFNGTAAAVTGATENLIDATTPPGTGTVDVTVENTDTAESGTLASAFAYKDRNVGGGYTDASLDGSYNYVAIRHDFEAQADPSDDIVVTTIGSDFNPAFAPINGGSTAFAGNGTYTVSSGADMFTVTNDGTPTTSAVDADAGSGTFTMASDGTLEMDTYKTGFLAPDGNALFVAATLHQTDRANALYVYAKEGSGSTPVSLNGKTMGVVAFVHDYAYPALGAIQVVYSYQGVATFTATNFTLTASGQSKNTDTGSGFTNSTSTGDDTGGAYDADTSGLFRLAFDGANDLTEVDLFDTDEVVGIFTVTDGTNPEDAQMFAGVNTSSTASNPGRNLLLFMVPLAAGKDASSFGGELEDLGWAQGLFGHEFNPDHGSTYLSADSVTSYDPSAVPADAYAGQVSEITMQGLLFDDLNWRSLAAANNLYGYTVQSAPTDDGQFTVDGPSPAIEGFISEDNSVNANVEASSTLLNRIRLELTK